MLKILITGGNGNIATMIKQNLHNKYNITALSREELNLLDYNSVETYLSNHIFDVCIHTAIKGGRRTILEKDDTTHINLLMFENIIKFSHKFKMIINFDSGAIYDRSTDILNRKEDELFTIPSDYYGFSKYVIYNRSIPYNNIYHLRIFNIFHTHEESDRFIKMCFYSKKNKELLKIFEDKYFDFIYEDDFIKIIDFYLSNINNKCLLQTVNVCYSEKYKLSDIAKIIINDDSLIHIENTQCNHNYSGDPTQFYSYKIPLDGMLKSLEKYNCEYEKYNCDLINKIDDNFISNRFCKIN